MSELKLLNCPFCGGEVEIALTGNKCEQWFVTRGFGDKKCTCRVFMESNLFSTDDSETIKGKEKDKLIEQWNTRTPMANIVEKLEELKEKGYAELTMLEVNELIDKAINIVKQEIDNGLE